MAGEWFKSQIPIRQPYLIDKVDEKLAYFADFHQSILGLMGKYLPS